MITHSKFTDKIQIVRVQYILCRVEEHHTNQHYYTGEERITSKIGTGVLAHLNDSIYLNTPNTPTKQSLTTTGYVNAWLCLGTLKPILCESKAQEPAGNGNSSNPEEGADAGEASAGEPSTGNLPGIVRPSCLSLIILRTFASSPANAPTTATYFYHPDHLSSSSWITDSGGHAIQHLQYLPFGELRVDQRTTSWNSRYTFSAKEKDAESGYGYFGARYYDSDLSIWLSVDPMADDFPWLTPYAYCDNNPIVMVDPFGEEFEFFANLLGIDIDPPQKKDPQKPNSQENPYEFPEPVVIKAPAPKQQKQKQQETKQQKANVITVPVLISIMMESVFNVSISVSTAMVSIFTALPILFGGDTRPGQMDEFSPHKSNASKSKAQKHTRTRPGGDPERGRYGKNRNLKKGDKNKKHIPYNNPNKRLNP